MAPPHFHLFSPLPDPETDEDEELTYENVQVPSVSGGPLSLASSGVGDKAGTETPKDVWRGGVCVGCVGYVCVLSWDSTVLLGGAGGVHNIPGKGGSA